MLAIGFALVLTSASLAAAEKDSPYTATILLYHIVESPQDPRMEISRETFRQHMRYLAATGYNVIPLRELYEYVTGKRASIPKNAVVVTIDDGWRSTYTEVWPEMKRRHFPFTVFVYPKIIGQTSYAMTWKQVKELAEAGVDIQSHSLSHPFLTHRRHAALDDKQYAEWLDRELVESKKVIEKETGREVSFLAYPYGDYDGRVTAAASRAGYAVGVTCNYGQVKRGSDPLRMRRIAIEKKMDFALFRRLLGNGSMRIEGTTPLPGELIDVEQPVVSAKIANFKAVDPKSVGMALIGVTDLTPYTYDPRDGSISLAVKDLVKNLKGKYQRALVWATDAKSGRRVEATWTFRLPETPALPVALPAATDPAACDPKDPPVTGAVPTEVTARTQAGSGARPVMQRQPK